VFIQEDGVMYTIVGGEKIPIEYSDIEPTIIQYDIDESDKWTLEDLQDN